MIQRKKKRGKKNKKRNNIKGKMNRIEDKHFYHAKKMKGKAMNAQKGRMKCAVIDNYNLFRRGKYKLLERIVRKKY